MSLEAISKFGFAVKTGGAEHADRYFAELRGIAMGYLHARDQARSNSNLTDAGRAARIAELAREANNKIAELSAEEGTAVAQVAARVAELRGRARALEPARPDDPRSELRAREIREALRAMAKDERSKVIARAVEETDEFVFASALDDPLNSVSPIIESSLRDRLLSAWVGTKNPELAEAITNQSALHQSMISLASSTQRAIEADAGVQPSLRERVGAA
ncbi:MAG: hypothetical protein NXI14_05970 [bacterium]|nr:hypothetical protein [bacterium]